VPSLLTLPIATRAPRLAMGMIWKRSPAASSAGLYALTEPHLHPEHGSLC
jgi:hypothetical protein